MHLTFLKSAESVPFSFLSPFSRFSLSMFALPAEMAKMHVFASQPGPLQFQFLFPIAIGFPMISVKCGRSQMFALPQKCTENNIFPLPLSLLRARSETL